MRERNSSIEGEGERAGETMRARRWAVAVRFNDPEDYDIPALPDWHEGCDSEGRLCLCAGRSREPFISAANPVPVRR